MCKRLSCNVSQGVIQSRKPFEICYNALEDSLLQKQGTINKQV